MNKHKPALPAAHLALYGNHTPTPSQPDTEASEFIELFLKLDSRKRESVITFLKFAVAGNDQQTEQMSREAEINLAYLQLESELQGGRSPKQLQQEIERDLNSTGGAE